MKTSKIYSEPRLVRLVLILRLEYEIQSQIKLTSAPQRTGPQELTLLFNNRSQCMFR